MTHHDTLQALSILALLGAVAALALAVPSWAVPVAGLPVLLWGATTLDRDPAPFGLTRWPLETALVAQLAAIVFGLLGWRWRWLGIGAECLALAGVTAAMRCRAIAQTQAGGAALTPPRPTSPL